MARRGSVRPPNTVEEEEEDNFINIRLENFQCALQVLKINASCLLIDVIVDSRKNIIRTKYSNRSVISYN